MFFNKKYKKIISSFLIIAFLVPSLFLTQPNKSEAISVVEVGANLVTNIINTVENTLQTGFEIITSGATWSTWIKDNILDGIAWTIAKMAVRQMTTSIVNWINSGFDGNPSFVTDFEGMMTDIADGVIGEYLYKNEKLKFLCSPFSLQLKMSLYNTFYGQEEKYRCTLSDAINNVGGSLQSLEDDFRWGTWIEMTNKPSNNIYGAFLEVEGEILEKILTKQQKKELQANWGGGILSKEVCENIYDGWGNIVDKKCTTVTPGSVIKGILDKTLGAGQDSLVTADEINEIIGALLTQLTTSVMSSTGLIGQKPSSYNNQENVNSLKKEVKDTITGSIETETGYKEIKNNSLDLVEGAIEYIELLIECLTGTGETSKLNLAQAFLDGNTNIPKTTIRININSKKTSLASDIASSTAIITNLNTLLTRANSATTANELSNIMNDYMTSSLDVHDLNDISDANIELNGYGTIVAGLENGLTYDIGLLLNTFASNTTSGRDGTITYPPEADKGIAQRYSECQACALDDDDCAYSGPANSSRTSSSSNTNTN